MSIEDDIALLERVPTLRLLGTDALRVLAIGSEQRDFERGELLFTVGEDADAGFVVQRGAFRVSMDDGSGYEIVVGPGTLIGELALLRTNRQHAQGVGTQQTHCWDPLEQGDIIFDRHIEPVIGAR